MILTIDIGNSNIVLGGVEDTDIRFEARLRTDATKTSDCRTGQAAAAGIDDPQPRFRLADVRHMGVTVPTLSVLDKNGAHIGGCICPGVKISLDALTDKTALLPGLQLDKPRRAIGRNTSDAMRSGIMLGAAAMIDGLVERMEDWGPS